MHRMHTSTQLLRCYREAPTSRARSNVFCVMYDYITSSQVGQVLGCAGYQHGLNLFGFIWGPEGSSMCTSRPSRH